ncbi:glycosyltransferases involved in cell wall biogenesis [Intestinibacter bartlettii CAG:1329]|uniref:Glycosyltransferases involved in cell wall biogenesis n=1 Tax=Intestinibacter bartlettii CAG:1329 TaxID=1263063 RepID=R5X4Q4_9FIRM|nr:glycosyltransferases involved in cell wall biogenesis [Intestinibacter bartlettii CAG:1329]
MGDKISVIIPIYKVEDYLHRCVDSIINQTYTNLEIILVDDGSPDNCPMICDEYSEKDSRIRVIHKKNGGLSDARNAGIDIATGKYIMFIDSDDFVDREMIESMMKNMIDNKVDMVVCNIKYVYEDREVVKYNQEDRILDRYEAMEEYLKDGVVQAVAWNKLYKKSLINDMRYKVGKTNEDEFFTYKVVDKTDKIYYNSKPFYNYIQRNSSIMGKYSIKRLDGVEASYERLNFIKEKYPTLYEKEKKTFVNLCIYSYQMILKEPNLDKDKQGRKILNNYTKKIKFNKTELKNYSYKDKLKIYLSKISLDACCKILDIL